MFRQIFKNRWFIWAIVFMIIAGFSIWGFIEYSKIKIESENAGNMVNLPRDSFSKQEETADWKTYRNEEYGFEFNYPSEFIAGEMLSSATILEHPGLLSLISLELKDPEGPGTPFTVMLFNNLQRLSIADWINKNRPGDYRDDVMISDIVVSGISGKQYASTKGYKLGVYFVKNNLIYTIDWHSYEIENFRRMEQFNQIVSTFKFIPQ